MGGKKTILIVGAGPDQLPAIKLAKELGYRVLTTDGNPEAIGFQYADDHALISTDDRNATLNYARHNSIDAIMTLVSETGVPTVAHVNQSLNLSGITPKLAFLATNKLAMRDAMREKGCPIPVYEKVDSYMSACNFIETHGLPAVIKPSDSSGQSGVTKIENMSQLEIAYEEAVYYAADGLAIIEEFVHGPEINVTALVNNGEITILSLSDRVTAEPPHFGIATRHIAPPKINMAQIEKVKNAAKCSIQAIGMSDGIAYPQIIVDNDHVYVVEIAARIPGGNMREVALYLSGVDLIRSAIYQALGQNFSLNDVCTEKSYPAVIVEFLTTLNTLPEGREIQKISGFELANAIDGIKLAFCNLKEGDIIPTLNSSRARFGGILAVANSKDECDKLIKKAKLDLVIH